MLFPRFDIMALFDVAQLQAQLKPLYNDFAYQYADEVAALARANMVYGTKDLKGTRNTGDQLRRITGALFKSLGRNDENNIFKITANDTGFVIDYGTSLPYAAIHEYGGVINHPGGTPFFIKNKTLHFVSKRNPLAARLPKTKPHTITMPARPYLNPAVQEFDKTTKPQYTDKIKFTIATEMIKWLEKRGR